MLKTTNTALVKALMALTKVSTNAWMIASDKLYLVAVNTNLHVKFELDPALFGQFQAEFSLLLPLKPLVKLLRSSDSVEISNQDDGLFVKVSTHSIVASYLFSTLNSDDPVMAIYDTTSFIKVNALTIEEILRSFPLKNYDVSLTVTSDTMEFVCENNSLCTCAKIDLYECDQFHIHEPVTLIFDILEFKNSLSFALSVSASISIMFSIPGQYYALIQTDCHQNVNTKCYL
jgi:hypothetical protein